MMDAGRIRALWRGLALACFGLVALGALRCMSWDAVSAIGTLGAVVLALWPLGEDAAESRERADMLRRQLDAHLEVLHRSVLGHWIDAALYRDIVQGFQPYLPDMGALRARETGAVWGLLDAFRAVPQQDIVNNHSPVIAQPKNVQAMLREV